MGVSFTWRPVNPDRGTSFAAGSGLHKALETAFGGFLGILDFDQDSVVNWLYFHTWASVTCFVFTINLTLYYLHSFIMRHIYSDLYNIHSFFCLSRDNLSGGCRLSQTMPGF